MRGSNLSKNELIEEIERLKGKLGSQFREFDTVGEMLSDSYGISRYRSLTKQMPKKLNRVKNVQRLKDLYRDLKYIDSLKSSTLQGALDVEQNFQPIKDKISVFSKDNQKKIWDIYRKFYAETHAQLGHYKYQLFDMIVDSAFLGMEEDAVVEDLLSLYTEVRKNYDQQEEIAQRFVQSAEEFIFD